MSNLKDSEPQVAPNEPAYAAKQRQGANEDAINNILDGSSKVNDYVKEEPTYTRPKIGQYVVPGGSKKKQEYNVFYKNVSFCIKANNLLEAVQEGYTKMVNTIPNFSKKKIKVSVQRKNKTRENHVYQFLVKRENIKNPKYKTKVTFVKL